MKTTPNREHPGFFTINLEHIFAMNINFNMLLRKPVFIAAVMALTSIMSYLLWIFNPGVTKENAAFEYWQDIFLILACLLYGYQYKHATNNMTKYARAGLMLFCFAILLREFDINKIGPSSIWKTIEILIRGATLIIFLVYLSIVRKKIYAAWKHAREIISSPMFILTILGCVAYICGWYFDKTIFKISKELSVFIEETLELDATLLFFLAACTNESHEKNLVNTCCNHSN